MRIGNDEYDFKYNEFGGSFVLTVEAIPVLKRRLSNGREAIQALVSFLDRRPRTEPAWSHLKPGLTLESYNGMWENGFTCHYTASDLGYMIAAARTLDMPRVVDALYVALVHKLSSVPPLQSIREVTSAAAKFGIQPATHFAFA